MRYSAVSAVCAALLATSGAAATSSYSSRPDIVASPKQPRLAFPSPAARTKFCTVQTHGNGSDDSAYILSAFHQCNDGGHVLFSKNATYTVGTAMDWTFLKHIDLGELPFLLLGYCSCTRVASRGLRVLRFGEHGNPTGEAEWALCSSGHVPMALVSSV